MRQNNNGIKSTDLVVLPEKQKTTYRGERLLCPICQNPQSNLRGHLIAVHGITELLKRRDLMRQARGNQAQVRGKRRHKARDHITTVIASKGTTPDIDRETLIQAIENVFEDFNCCPHCGTNIKEWLSIAMIVKRIKRIEGNENV